MKAEQEFISALCRTKDVETVMSAGIESMIHDSYTEVFDEAIAHWHKYGTIPAFEVLQEKFPDLYHIETTEPMEYYTGKVKEAFITRQMQQAVKDAKDNLRSGGVYALSRLVDQLNVLSRETGVVKDLDISDVDAAVEDYTKRAELAENDSLGIRTGIEPFDMGYPTGMAGGHFISVIGWSGYGKTAFTTYLATNAWLRGKSVMFVSLEMSSEQMRDRIITTLGAGKFNGNAISRGDIDIASFESWGRKTLERPNRLVIISSEGSDEVTINTVQAKVDQYKPDLVVLDYLQLFDDASHGGNETVKIRNISRDSKRMALRNDIPVIGLTQATQDNKSDLDQPPLIEQVAWSKGIQHDSDLALAVHKPPNKDYMEVISRKNRHGPLFGFYLDVDMENGIWDVRYEDPTSGAGNPDDILSYAEALGV